MAPGRGISQKGKSVKNGKYETSLLQLDISKALNKLKWEPKLDFIETIKYTVKEYQINNMTNEEIHKQRVESILRYMKK